MKYKTIHRIKIVATAIVLLAIALFFFSSCKKSTTEPEYTAKEFVYEAFKEWYLWYDEIPNLDANDYNDYQSLIEAISIDDDKWSFAMSNEALKRYYESGEQTSFGAGLIIDFDGQIKITHVYNNSPFGQNGIERGWIVDSVNGYTVDELDKVNEALSSNEPIDFVFTDHIQQTHSHTMQKEAYNINAIFHSQVFDLGTNKVAYLVYNNFTESSISELESVFNDFKNQEITDLIVDLRYNGGGLDNVAQQLMGLIGGNKIAGQVVERVIYNDKHSDNNKTVTLDYEGVSVDIDKVCFLTTHGTASASEICINSLKPFVDVKVIGSRSTGKFFGMHHFVYEKYDLVVLPLSLRIANSNNETYNFVGIPVDIDEYDDLKYNWGNPEEAMLKAALNEISNPVLAISNNIKSEKIEKQQLFKYTGINQLINAY